MGKVFLRDFMNFARCTAPINGHAVAMKMKASQIKELALKLFANVFSGNVYCSMPEGKYGPRKDIV